MVRLFFTVHDGGMPCNVGGSVESTTRSIHIDFKDLPTSVQRYLLDPRYCSLTISYSRDQEEERPDERTGCKVDIEPTRPQGQREIRD